MAIRAKGPCPVVGTAAGFHGHGARGQLGDEAGQTCAGELLAQHPRSALIGAMKMETAFGQIDADKRDPLFFASLCHWSAPLPWLTMIQLYRSLCPLRAALEERGGPSHYGAVPPLRMNRVRFTLRVLARIANRRPAGPMAQRLDAGRLDAAHYPGVEADRRSPPARATGAVCRRCADGFRTTRRRPHLAAASPRVVPGSGAVASGLDWRAVAAAREPRAAGCGSGDLGESVAADLGAAVMPRGDCACCLTPTTGTRQSARLRT